MRICFIVRALPTHRLGGLEHHVRDLALGLSDRGHDVEILTTSGGSADELSSARTNLRVHEIPGTKAGDYNIRFFATAGRVALSFHKERRYDVIVPIDLAGLFISADKFDCPLVPLIHGTMTSEVPLNQHHWQHLSGTEKLQVLWRYKSRVLLRPWFRRMLRRAEALVVDSEYTRRELVFETNSLSVFHRTQVVRLGIDPNRYPDSGAELLKGDGPLRICMLGRLQKIKGVEIAIRAAGQLQLRGVDFHLSVAGSGDYMEEARRLVSELGLDELVTFTGRVPPEELPGFFAANDLFLFPDLTQPAFGLVAVEAMAYGLPVIAARAGAIPEVVTEDCGWLYDAWNVDELAGLLWEISVNRITLRSKAKAALCRSELFRSSRMAEDMEQALSRVIGAMEQRKSGLTEFKHPIGSK